MGRKKAPRRGAPGATLIEIAEALLATMLRKDGKDGRSSLGNPDGSMISSEWTEMWFNYDGKRRKLSVPSVVLRDAGHDFQLGYIYGTLAQKVRPHVRRCPDCGKLHEPTYGFKGSTLYRADGDAKDGGR